MAAALLRRADDAEVDAITGKGDVAQESADERRTVTVADQLGFSDEQVDPERRPAEGDHRGIFGVVVDPVALDLADRAAVQLDHVEVGRILAAYGAHIVRDRVVRVGLRRNVVVPPPHVGTQQPGANEAKVLFTERWETEFRRC